MGWVGFWLLVLGLPPGFLGPPGGLLGASWGPPGGLLGASWGLPRASGLPFGAEADFRAIFGLILGSKHR